MRKPLRAETALSLDTALTGDGGPARQGAPHIPPAATPRHDTQIGIINSSGILSPNSGQPKRKEMLWMELSRASSKVSRNQLKDNAVNGEQCNSSQPKADAFSCLRIPTRNSATYNGV